MKNHVASFYYVEDKKPQVESKFVNSNNIYDIEIPYESTFLVKLYDLESGELTHGQAPSEPKMTNVKNYAIGLEMNRKAVEEEYGKDSQVMYEMLTNSCPSICVNPTDDWYVLINKDITPIHQSRLKYANEKLFAEIHYNDQSTQNLSAHKLTIPCEKADIRYVEIPEQIQNISYINFFKIVGDTKIVGGKKVKFYSEPIYLDKRYVVGQKIDFKDIDENSISYRLYRDLYNVYEADKNTTFCKTSFGITTLSKNEELISENKLNYTKIK